jgi:thiosulfate dehydrogenase [quinone] large subunit
MITESESPSQPVDQLKNSKMTDSKETANVPAPLFDYTLAFLVLRLWLAVRNILTGIEKFGAYKIIQKPLIDQVTGLEDPSGATLDVKVKFYAFKNYSGIPASLKDKFSNEPLLPHPLLTLFDRLLGPALIVTGLMLLLGLGTRLSLFAQGLIYVALTVGLILIHQDDGISWLGIHVVLIAIALVLARHNRFAILKKW